MRDEQGFEEDRAREIVRRAIEIDAGQKQLVAADDIRLIAAELDVNPAAVDQAFREMGSEIVARPAPPARALRRWLPFMGVVAAGAAVVAIAPEALRDVSMVAPYLLILVAAFFAASTKINEYRSAMRIGEDGIIYRGRKGRKVLPWESVLEIKPFLPNVVHVVGTAQTITVVLEDFGDPDAVLRLMRSRTQAAQPTV
jgi:hypothetical protein